ncbi:MAG: hypothetical protein ACJ72I_10195, partial [Pseudonocardiaceae bacterium]
QTVVCMLHATAESKVAMRGLSPVAVLSSYSGRQVRVGGAGGRAAAPGNAGSDTAADHVEVFDAARLCW